MQDYQYISLIKSSVDATYICQEKISYDFYLLYLLLTEDISQPDYSLENSYKNKENIGIKFYKNNSLQCLTTLQLLIHKNNGYIELFSMYDLKDLSNLKLPQSPKFVMTAKNFIQFMIDKKNILQQNPSKIFIVLDKQGHAHVTTRIETLQKPSFLNFLHQHFKSLLKQKNK